MSKKYLPQDYESLAKTYKKLHWGKEGAEFREIDNPHAPDRMVEMGKLSELRVVPLSNDKPGSSKKIAEENLLNIEIEEDKINDNILFVDTIHPQNRLYLHFDDEALEDGKEFFDLLSDAPVLTLNQLSNLAGGDQAGEDYPNLRAKPIGRLSHILYVTLKEGEGGPATYVHEMGEEWKKEEGIRPILAISANGQMWIVGGSYRVEAPGIIK